MRKHISALLLLLVMAACHALARAPKTRVACIGNSITYGLTLHDPATESYPARLQQMLGEGYEVGNFGKSGTTLLRHGHRPYVAQEEWQRAKAFKPDIAVIHLGVNDTDPRNWPYYRDEFVADYLAIIDTLRQINPACDIRVALLSPITHRHPRFKSGTRDWQREISEAIAAVARIAKVGVVDFHKPLYAYPQLIPDAVHPDSEGQEKLAHAVYAALTGDYGGLRMPMTFSDNMVLQRDRELLISGSADAGEKVRVEITRQTPTPPANKRGRRVRGIKPLVVQAETTADASGTWSVTLAPQRAAKNLTLTISTAKRSLVYNNVAYGEVWLCSGQSNMEFMLEEAATASRDIPSATNADIRLFDMKARWRTNAEEWTQAALYCVDRLQYFSPTQWTLCTPQTAQDFSAIAYYFGRVLQDSLQVPVGLICNAVGGSPTEAWVSREELEDGFPDILADWTANDFIQPWVRERAALNMKRTADIKAQRHPYEPCYLYESAIEPLGKFPIKGVLWYQGESNAQNYATHDRLFRLLVDSWRKNWSNAHLPFYYVQLSSLDRLPWQWFRDGQRRLLGELQDVAMAVSSDVGDSLNVHPARKQPVGERLARIALHNLYGYTGVAFSGPLVKTAKAVGNGAVRLTFDYGERLATADNEPLRTFEVAEEEGFYKPATARIEGESIVVVSPEVAHPRYVRYGWQPFTRANLVGRDGLPASTFRVEVAR